MRNPPENRYHKQDRGKATQKCHKFISELEQEIAAETDGSRILFFAPKSVRNPHWLQVPQSCPKLSGVERLEKELHSHVVLRIRSCSLPDAVI